MEKWEWNMSYVHTCHDCGTHMAYVHTYHDCGAQINNK